MTFLILKGISLFTSLRMKDSELEIGDLAVHDEVAYPEDDPDPVGADEAMIGSATDHKGIPSGLNGEGTSDGSKVLAE